MTHGVDTAERAVLHILCVCALTLCALSLSLRAGSPAADAREALRVSQEQAAAADSQRSC